MVTDTEAKISVISIIVSDTSAAQRVNGILHEYGEYIIGRLGVPYHEKKISVICVVLNAPPSVISTVSGKIGMLEGVSSKSVTAKA